MAKATLPSAYVLSASNPRGDSITYRCRHIDFSAQSLSTPRWEWTLKGYRLPSIGCRGELYVVRDSESADKLPGVLEVFSKPNTLLFRAAIPKPFHASAAKYNQFAVHSPEVFGGGYWAAPDKMAYAMFILDSKHQWTKIPDTNGYTTGKTPDEFFFSMSTNGKLAYVKIWNRRTGTLKTVTPSAFRQELWPAARIAFDRFGADEFFNFNSISRPGYAIDPAYVLTRIDENRNHMEIYHGTSAVVLRSGKVFKYSYKGMGGHPWIASTVQSGVMYVLADDISISGDKSVLGMVDLLQVDSNRGLVRVASVANATGASFAFAE